MKVLLAEIDANFECYKTRTRLERAETEASLDAADQVFRESYRRLTSLQGWRGLFLSTILSEGSLAFFVEAQNDALVSHSLARLGAWRSALVSLRSVIENVVLCLYYKDHPVELQLWAKGKHRLTFSAGIDYLRSHPALEEVAASLSGVDMLSKEYGVLSRAVHASAASFRMTGDGGPSVLWVNSEIALGGWRTRERICVEAINLLLIALFRERVQGAGHRGLRQSISLGISAVRFGKLRSGLGVALSRT